MRGCHSCGAGYCDDSTRCWEGVLKPIDHFLAKSLQRSYAEQVKARYAIYPKRLRKRCPQQRSTPQSDLKMRARRLKYQNLKG